MKAIVVTVIAPSSWSETDIVSSMHIGMRKYAEDKNWKLGSMDYHAMAHSSFELKRQDDVENAALDAIIKASQG